MARFARALFKKEILRPYRNQYLKWLRYSLNFGSTYRFVASDTRSLSGFIQSLEENNQTTMQWEQAVKAFHEPAFSSLLSG